MGESPFSFSLASRSGKIFLEERLEIFLDLNDIIC